MTSMNAKRSGKHKRAARFQLVGLTAALLLALVALPVSANHTEGAENISSFVETADADSARLASLGDYYTTKAVEAGHTASSSRYSALAQSYAAADADTDRLAALGQFYAAQNLDSGHSAAAARYKALAGHYGGATGFSSEFLAANPELRAAIAWTAALGTATGSSFLAANPETKYANGWGGTSAGAAASSSEEISSNPELSSFRNYCGC